MWILLVVYFTAAGPMDDTITVTDTAAQCETAKVKATQVADKDVAKGKYKGYLLVCREMQKVK